MSSYLWKAFECKVISSIDSLNDVNGRSHGGLAILWHKELAGICKVVEYDDDCFLGIEVCNSDKSMLFINVYLLYDVQENIDDYSYCLAKIESSVTERRFGKELTRFYGHMGLKI